MTWRSIGRRIQARSGDARSPIAMTPPSSRRALRLRRRPGALIPSRRRCIGEGKCRQCHRRRRRREPHGPPAVQRSSRSKIDSARWDRKTQSALHNEDSPVARRSQFSKKRDGCGPRTPTRGVWLPVRAAPIVRPTIGCAQQNRGLSHSRSRPMDAVARKFRRGHGRGRRLSDSRPLAAVRLCPLSQADWRLLRRSTGMLPFGRRRTSRHLSVRRHSSGPVCTRELASNETPSLEARRNHDSDFSCSSSCTARSGAVRRVRRIRRRQQWLEWQQLRFERIHVGCLRRVGRRHRQFGSFWFRHGQLGRHRFDRQRLGSFGGDRQRDGQSWKHGDLRRHRNLGSLGSNRERRQHGDLRRHRNHGNVGSSRERRKRRDLGCEQRCGRDRDLGHEWQRGN